jgi:O-antigen/teichoic acid export membrane protein
MEVEQHKTLVPQTFSLPALWTNFRGKIIGRKFVQHVGILTVSNLIGAALSFAQGILVARWLGPELYGVAALVMSYPNIVYTFFDARSTEASVKFLSEFHAHNERERVLAICKLGYAVDFAIASMALLVVVVSAHWAARSVASRPEAAWLIIAYTLAFIPRAMAGTSYAVLATLSKFSLVAIVEVAAGVLRTGLVIGLVLAGWQVAGVVWGNAIGLIATGLFYGFVASLMMRRTWGASLFQGNWSHLKGRRREILGFLAYNDLSAFLSMIPKQLDVVLLGYFRNPAEVGYYKLAKSLSSATAYFTGPLQWVTYPQLLKLNNPEQRQLLYRKVRRIVIHVGLPMGLAVLAGTVLMPFLLPLLVGDSYHPAIHATQLLLVGSAVSIAFFWLRPLYLAQGALKAWVTLAAVAVGLSLVGFFTAIPLWGFQGLATWLMLMTLMTNGMAALYLMRQRKLAA